MSNREIAMKATASYFDTLLTMQYGVGPMFEPFNAQGEVKDKQVVNQRKVKTATAGFES